MSFNKILIEGPEVSLKGSPTVSPTTAALCVSEPFPPRFPCSTNFLALSHAPPAFDIVAFVEAKRTITTKTGTKEETYNRSFKINGSDFDVEKLKAEITDGVLRVNVPRLERKEQKVINVEVS